MRISDWSSDVCSSDLLLRHVVERFPELLRLGRIGEHDAAQYLRREVRQAGEADRRVLGQRVADAERAVIGDADDVAEIGRAAWRAGVGHTGSISVVAGTLKKNTTINDG